MAEIHTAPNPRTRIILLNVLLFAKLLIASVAFVCTGVVIRSRYEAVLSGMGASLPLVTQFVLDLPAFVFLIVPGVLAAMRSGGRRPGRRRGNQSSDESSDRGSISSRMPLGRPCFSLWGRTSSLKSSSFRSGFSSVKSSRGS